MRDKTVPTEPTLVVRPAEAFRILRVGKTLGFQMLKDGTLERVPLGRRAIGVTMASIKRVAEGRLPRGS